MDLAQAEPDSANEVESLAKEERYRGLIGEREFVAIKKAHGNTQIPVQPVQVNRYKQCV